MLANERFYRPELDALRFFAFSLVFIRHVIGSFFDEMSAAGGFEAAIAYVSLAGSYGVDLFFLLSAYLITELFVREKIRTGRINVQAFYIRRILRIWPLYYTFLITCYGLSKISPVQFPDAAIVPFALMFGNWYLVGHEFFSPAGILWSVSIEEQFYLLWPLAARNLSPRDMAWTAIALLITAWVARLMAVDGSSWVNTFTRLDPIAAGIFVALLLDGQMPKFPTWQRGALCVGGLGAFILAATVFHGLSPTIGRAEGLISYPLAMLGALAIFLGFLGADLSKWRSVIYLGRISYGLYVFHLLALGVTKALLIRELGTCPILLRGAIAFPLTVALAAVSYRWLEMPFLRIKSRLSAPIG